MKKDGIYTLPRETVYLRESLEDSLVRGVEEEVGIVVKPKRFLGSQISFFKRSDGSNIEKTTLYFLVEKVGKGFKKQEFDEKQDREVVMNIEEAIEVLKNQHNDEYRILQKISGLK